MRERRQRLLDLQVDGRQRSPVSLVVDPNELSLSGPLPHDGARGGCALLGQDILVEEADVAVELREMQIEPRVSGELFGELWRERERGGRGRRAPRDGEERARREQDLKALELDPVLERATDDLWFQVEVLVAFVGHFVGNEDWRTSDSI